MIGIFFDEEKELPIRRDPSLHLRGREEHYERLSRGWVWGTEKDTLTLTLTLTPSSSFSRFLSFDHHLQRIKDVKHIRRECSEVSFLRQV